MTGLIGRIARREIVPRSTSAQHPKYTVQNRTRVLPWPPASIGPSLWTKQRFENRPLGVGNVNILDLRRLPYVSTVQSVECVYEITSRLLIWLFMGACSPLGSFVASILLILWMS